MEVCTDVVMQKTLFLQWFALLIKSVVVMAVLSCSHHHQIVEVYTTYPLGSWYWNLYPLSFEDEVEAVEEVTLLLEEGDLVGNLKVCFDENK